MKALILTNIYPTESEPYGGIFIHRQALGLKKRDVEPIVLKLDLRSARKKRRYGFYQSVIDSVKVYTYSFPCGPIPCLLESLYMAFSLCGYKKVISLEGKIDLVHAHFTVMGCCAARIKKSFHTPVILTEHSSALIEKKIKKTTVLQCRYAYRHMDKILAVGSNLKSSMERYTDKSIELVPNVLSPLFSSKDRAFNSGKEFIFVTVVGMATRDKKLDILAEAFYALSRKYENVRLWIIGEGKRIDELRREAYVLKKEEKARFMGIVANDELPEIYRKCHCFVLPSIKETFGMVYIEAAGCGLPVIGCHSGGTKDIITEKNGLIADNDNVLSLKNAMEDVMLNIDRYNSEDISSEMRQKFGIEQIASRLICIYKDLAEERSL